MSHDTITVAGTTALALPAELHPVAYAATPLPVRTWAVISRPDDGPPFVEQSGLPSDVAARILAAVLAGSYGPLNVFVVYRSPDAVTVHTAQIGQRGSCLGSVAAEHVDPDIPPLYRMIRPNHRPDAVEPIPADWIGSALADYVHRLGDPEALHEHAVTANRRQLTHRATASHEPHLPA